MSDEHHAIDLAETFAEEHDFAFDRVDDDQIAMVIEEQWRTYSVTLFQSHFDDTLRIIMTFEMQPPEERLSALYEMLNLVNDQCWMGSFTFWKAHQYMVYRYGLLTSEEGVSVAQVTTIIETAVSTAERFYPAMQLAVWGNKSPEESLQVAISGAVGRA